MMNSSGVYIRNDILLTSLKKIDEILHSAENSHFVITDRLELIDKRNFKWKILALFQPFVCCFGGDLYSHVRLNNVAQSIFNIFQDNLKLMNERPELAWMIEDRIFKPLMAKAKGKNPEALQKVLDAIKKRHLCGMQVAEKGPDHSVNPWQAQTKETSLSELHWPNLETLNRLKISADQCEPIKTPLMKYLKDIEQNPQLYDLRFSKTGEKGARKREIKLIKIQDQEWDSETTISQQEIALSLRVVHNSQRKIADIILLSKEVLAKGGQTKVRLGYSLLKDICVVRKKCEWGEPSTLLKHFQHHPTQGIAPILSLYDKGDKIQVTEPLLEGTLKEKLSSLNLEDKLQIAHDLLQGLNAIHTTPRRQSSIDRGDGLFYAHRDLKPMNILIQRIDNKYRAFITDFGLTNVEIEGGSFFWRSPEQIKTSLAVKKPEGFFFGTSPPIKDQIRYIQKSDMWSLGLILAELFYGKDTIVPPLISMINLRARRPLPEIVDQAVPFFFQQDIDNDLGTAQREQNTPDPITGQWWYLIRQMVRLNPEERITVSQALERVASFSV